MQVYKDSKFNYVTVAKILKKEIDKIDIDICKQPKETLESYYKRQIRKPNVLTNAGFFDMATGRTVFSVINEGKVINDSKDVKLGIGILNNNEIHYGTSTGNKWRDFMSAYPPLIVDGKIYNTKLASSINYRTRRTVLGYNKEYVFIICVDNPGMNFAQLRSFCLNLGCIYAINLDGGGSSRMLVDGVRKTSLLASRQVDSILAIYLKQENKIVDYTIVSTYPSNLNIRSGPGTNFNIIGYVKPKENKHIVEECYYNNWIKIENSGWINGYYAKKVNSSNASSFGYIIKAKITASVLNVRSGPSILNKICGQYFKNEIVDILEEKGNWYRTDKGWVYSVYAKKL